MYRRLFSDFVHPKGWWPPLVEARHGMQGTGPAAWAFPEGGKGLFAFIQEHFADLAVYSGLVIFLEGRGQDAVVPDAGKSLGQDVEGEPPEELSCFQLTGFPFSLLPVVLYREADLSVLEAQYAVITDGDLVGVPAQVFFHLPGTEEGPFAVDDPFFGKQLM